MARRVVAGLTAALVGATAALCLVVLVDSFALSPSQQEIDAAAISLIPLDTNSRQTAYNANQPPIFGTDFFVAYSFDNALPAQDLIAPALAHAQADGWVQAGQRFEGGGAQFFFEKQRYAGVITFIYDFAEYDGRVTARERQPSLTVPLTAAALIGGLCGVLLLALTSNSQRTPPGASRSTEPRRLT